MAVGDFLLSGGEFVACGFYRTCQCNHLRTPGVHLFIRGFVAWKCKWLKIYHRRCEGILQVSLTFNWYTRNFKPWRKEAKDNLHSIKINSDCQGAMIHHHTFFLSSTRSLTVLKVKITYSAATMGAPKLIHHSNKYFMLWLTRRSRCFCDLSLCSTWQNCRIYFRTIRNEGIFSGFGWFQQRNSVVMLVSKKIISKRFFMVWTEKCIWGVSRSLLIVVFRILFYFLSWTYVKHEILF